MPKDLKAEIVTRDYLAKRPDHEGVVAVITYSMEGNRLHPQYARFVQNPFPWSATLYRCTERAWHEIVFGSSPVDLLEEHHVKKVYLVGVQEEQQKELASTLVEAGIRLV